MFFSKRPSRPARSQRNSRSNRANKRNARFIPGVEQLEIRAVPAATLSLSAAGMLTVNGTSGKDSIVFTQTNGRVSVAGVSKSFAADSVKSITVNTGAGNDSVSLSGLNSSPWTKPITIKNAAGIDAIKLLNGTTTNLNGTNSTLTIPASGGSTPNNNGTGDWFDQNIQDAALRQLLRTSYADQVLNRTDVLAVFNQVRSDGTVTTDEFNDLKDVASNTSLFGSSSYIADITQNVVLGNAANAKYQGTTLGNLSAGASAAKLDKLVNKWFVGADRPVASYSGMTVTYVTANGSLFGSGGPKYTDVRQGAVGDCYFVGTLAEVALRTPATIQNMFVINGDGSYGVRFYQNGTSRWVTVDSQLPTYSGGWFLYANMGSRASDASNVLWVALAEKAYVQMNEAGWLRPAGWGGGINSYDGIEGGMFTDAARQIANRAGSNYYVNGTSDDASLNNAVTTGKLVGFASKGTPADSRVVGNHQYVVVGYNSSTKTVTLFNPWGMNNGSSYPGLVNLTLSQLGSSFDYWSVA